MLERAGFDALDALLDFLVLGGIRWSDFEIVLVMLESHLVLFLAPGDFGETVVNLVWNPYHLAFQRLVIGAAFVQPAGVEMGNSAIDQGIAVIGLDFQGAIEEWNSALVILVLNPNGSEIDERA